MPGWRAFGDARLQEQLYGFEQIETPEVTPPLELLLAFAQSTIDLTPYWRAARIRPELGISEFRYAVLINRAIENPEAERLAPELIARLRTTRDERREKRARAKPIGGSTLG